MANYSCCSCIHFVKREEYGKVCSGLCKTKEACVVCSRCRDLGINKCEKYEYKCNSCVFNMLGCPLDRNTCSCYEPLRQKNSSCFNGKACHSFIEFFFRYHQNCTPIENFLIGNILKSLWHFKGLDSGHELKAAKDFIEYLIDKEREQDYDN